MSNVEEFSLANVVAAHRSSLEVQRRALTIAWEHRRRAIERALHDGLQQQLLALRIELLRATRLEDPESVRTFATLAIAQIDATADELRHLASGGRLSVLDVGDLGAALRELAAHAALVVSVIAPTGIAIEGPVAEVLVFTVSEALANTLRYAPGAQVWIELQQHADELVLSVRDNGPGGAAFVSGHGLDGLRRRVEALGGSFTLGLGEAFAATQSALGPRQTATSSPDRATSSPDRIGNVLNLRFPSSSVGVDGTDTSTLPPATQNLNPVGMNRDYRSLDGGRGNGTNQELVMKATVQEAVVAQADEERLSAALARLRSELQRVTTQVELFEASLAARLASVPVKELTEARNALAESNLILLGAAAFAAAAAHVEQANERLREVVSQLRLAEAEQQDSGQGRDSIAKALSTSLTNLANQCGIVFTVGLRQAQALGDPAASKSVERIVEELIHDADPGSAMSLQLRMKSHRLIGSINLSRLPSPLTVAFVNELVYAARGAWSVSSVGDSIQAKVELPCV